MHLIHLVPLVATLDGGPVLRIVRMHATLTPRHNNVEIPAARTAIQQITWVDLMCPCGIPCPLICAPVTRTRRLAGGSALLLFTLPAVAQSSVSLAPGTVTFPVQLLSTTS